MTMRFRNEPVMTMPAIDPDKTYAFTWPGQPRRAISGADLLALLKGANPEMLDISESNADASTVPTLPASEGGHE